MGKYQLDYKGQASVQKFHEKNSTGKSDKQKKLDEIKANYLNKKKKSGKSL
ncbi:hypothetical protein [Pseudolactococcus insecticola]|uniref:30S ribosomal protein S10 n=1 Tax=Pseudolactococcus insecticola TaxID=2709158 RepID=A0A6A0B8E7_9LACT|nr:hypothetical protein [Lactococcus insecticola]GFH41055.1 hypothetical protein Hs20B_14530 [Lactococcus insecticola]